MRPIASSAQNADHAALERRPWNAGDRLRADSELKSHGHSAAAPGFAGLAGVRFCRLNPAP